MNLNYSLFRRPTMAILLCLITSSAQADQIFSFDEIEFWVGAGTNQSALAIDWEGQNGESNSLVWGYRWDGVQSTTDMFTAIVAADSRLFAKIGSQGTLGTAVYGIGYDASSDGQFSLDDNTVFDANGLAQSGPSDLAVSEDLSDFYREGWFLGFWHHGVTTGTPENWSGGPGISGRTISDLSWDSLAFTTSILDDSSFASGLLPAERTTIPGDYNRNGTVDAADFTLWQDSLGEPVFAAGFGADGNLDWQIDSADYDFWIASFDNDSTTLPEPTCTTFVWMAFLSIQLNQLRAKSCNE